MPPATPDMTIARQRKPSSSKVAVIAAATLPMPLSIIATGRPIELAGQDLAARELAPFDAAHIVEQRRDFFRHGADDAEGDSFFQHDRLDPNGGAGFWPRALSLKEMYLREME